MKDKAPNQKAIADKFSDCKVCHEIWHRFTDSDATHQLNLGSLEDVISSGCPRHRPLVESFRDYCRPSRHSKIDKSHDIGIVAGRKGSSVTLTQSLSTLGLFWNLLLVKKAPVTGHAGTGRIIDPN